MKTIFKCSVCGDIHWGVSAPELCGTCNTKNAYKETTTNDLEALLKDLQDKILFRCTICGDLHIGVKYPKLCPTCFTLDVYVEVNAQEFDILINKK